MKPFARIGDTVEVEFDAEEAAILSVLASQVAGLVSGRSDLDDDPAVLRLLPDAFPTDPEASAEFRRFTVDGLAERKVANAETIVRLLAPATLSEDPTVVTLDPSETQAWLRSLTDIRLTIASRLGIEKEGDEPSDDPVMAELYDWLGWVQGSLVEVLDD